jgi:hypothetical protein
MPTERRLRQLGRSAQLVSRSCATAGRPAAPLKPISASRIGASTVQDVQHLAAKPSDELTTAEIVARSVRIRASTGSI